MGFVLQANCSKCKYRSKELIVGDGLHFIFICKNCNSVVNAQRMPFRYTLSTCPNCKNLLRESNWVNIIGLVTIPDAPIESYLCPQCQKNPLTFESLAHFSRSFDLCIPEIGMLLHGMYDKSGELAIPFLAQTYCVAIFENASSYTPSKIMELRVTRLEPEPSDAENEQYSSVNVFLEFVRYLSQEDLERESIKQPQFKSKTREVLEMTGSISDDNAA